MHHDLELAYKYFVWVILLNMRLIASGPKEDVFTPELLQETYGGKLTLLDSLSNFIRRKEFPIQG